MREFGPYLRIQEIRHGNRRENSNDSDNDQQFDQRKVRRLIPALESNHSILLLNETRKRRKTSADRVRLTVTPGRRIWTQTSEKSGSDSYTSS